MKKLYLSKHKNGYYYIYYNDDNGKRKSITTKTKINSEALIVLSSFDELLKVIDNNDWRDIVEFAVNTGLRQMEILNLHKRQFNKQDRLIILDNHYHTAKSRKIRNMPLNSRALEIVTRRIEQERSELIFTLDGDRILQDNLQDKFRKYVEAAKLNPKLTIHCLRHTFASWLVQKGVSIYEVSKLPGHADIKTTQLYAHLRIDDLRDAVEMLD